LIGSTEATYPKRNTSWLRKTNATRQLITKTPAVWIERVEPRCFGFITTKNKLRDYLIN
jgi:hypothetical protein